ncbi:MAG: hypothetical protein CVT95_00130 [Bacteroidetes bacterium HGW-Bacteroidetes-12]|nr:MAG: hypothetical protein CVT95_00130 [Bacteroidetes bacterium HGW-Bacteroidetes-12]
MKQANINFIVFILLLFTVKIVSAQHSELGFMGGLAYYTGELNPSPNPQNKTRPMLGVFFRRNLNYRYSLRFGANAAQIAAEDKQKTNESFENFETRNLSFSGNLLDAYGVLEFNFIPYQINNSASKFTPFVFIGIAGYYVAQKIENTKLNSTQESSLTSLALPFGAGLKFNFVQNIGMTIEWTYRKTFTDKFDGLGETHFNGVQLSNSGNKDWYSFINLTLSYKFLRKRDVCAMPVN